MRKMIKEIILGAQKITLEVGEIARQASGSVVVKCGDAVVLVTAVGQKRASEGRDFFPLTVNYQERTYAAGRIPGGFLKREGRPGDHETLISRLIDRPLRPLFPRGFINEVQVIATVFSLDPEVQSDILALIGASAALSISGLPFEGPIGAARVGYNDGVYSLNPSATQCANSELDLVVAGTEDAILMVESQANQLSEEIMLGAILYGHEMMQSTIKVIRELSEEVGRTAWDYTIPQINSELRDKVAAIAQADIEQAYLIREKAQRTEQLAQLRNQVISELVQADDALAAKAIYDEFSAIEKAIVRKRVLNGEARIDGRDSKTVRPISIRTGVLPRVHGSALFTRGETQALVVATLGNDRDAQLIDAASGEYRDRFMLHYNFPPYCVGETGMVGSPKRREIGHGKLARRGVEAVLPTEKEFPYVLRVVSEITESNGSSSMASVCGTSLALMDAGVPVKAHVAGIAMGLVKEDDKFVVLTDILGDEDYLGDMDFKVAGTHAGITALQMDIKIKGITKEIMQAALEQALVGRKHILQLMEQNIEGPRQELSAHAPRISVIKIDPDKIRDVIGKGGATIKSITEATGVSIDISDNGEIQLFAPDEDSAAAAAQRIKDIVADVEVGKIYEGKISKIVDFGAFVNILPGRDGLLHISQISNERIENVSDVLTEGQEISVKVLEVDRQGRVKLSIKAIQTEIVA